jgi:hypothetical protein
MKKFIGYLFCFCFITNVFGQYDAANWQVNDNTSSLYGIYLNHSCGYDSILLSGPLVELTNPAESSYSWNEDNICVYTINGTVTTNEDAQIIFNTTPWTGGTGKKFTTDLLGVAQASDTAQGFSIDFSDEANRGMSFKVQTAEPITLSFYLRDINGKISNGSEVSCEIPATIGGVNIIDAAKWTTITVSWAGDATASANVNSMIDATSTDWWGVSNVGYRDAIQLLDSTRIVGIIISAYTPINPQNSKVVFLKDIVIGSGPLIWGDDCNDTIKIDKISKMVQIKNYPTKLTFSGITKSSEITITDISGKTIYIKTITSDDSISTEFLPQGVYIVQVNSESGNAQMKLVKK